MVTISTARVRRITATLTAAGLACTTGALAACTPVGDGEPAASPAVSATATTESSSPTSEPSDSAGAKRRRGDEELVDTVRSEFSTLAPESLFDALETCSQTSLKDTYDCTGAKVGQFQFFASETMAQDTADVLTDLASSHTVEDTGDKIVGWSMLGKTAVITVVDKQAGKVLQQMVSSDVDDPEKRIYDLGLAEGGGATTAPSSASAEEPEHEPGA